MPCRRGRGPPSGPGPVAHDDGKCVIVVTHSKEVAAASDEVLHLKRGKLTA
ncbi:hypothetical protein [Streptomyces formicae]